MYTKLSFSGMETEFHNPNLYSHKSIQNKDWLTFFLSSIHQNHHKLLSNDNHILQETRSAYHKTTRMRTQYTKLTNWTKIDVWGKREKMTHFLICSSTDCPLWEPSIESRCKMQASPSDDPSIAVVTLTRVVQHISNQQTSVSNQHITRTANRRARNSQ